MGQQQLLLLILALIVIGVSITIANQIFNTSAEDSNKDSIVSELTNLGTIALQYFNKPAAMAGGGKSFTNWQIPAQLDTSNSGTYIIAATNIKTLMLTGSPIKASGYTWSVKTTIFKNSIVNEIIY